MAHMLTHTFECDICGFIKTEHQRILAPEAVRLNLSYPSGWEFACGIYICPKHPIITVDDGENVTLKQGRTDDG
ncbi:MAG TPA: hypothetical protein VNH18_06485 [Bryobacteraceae bacterium]|nr:hypothetical protein [Bryobacteraceae bacterium]